MATIRLNDGTTYEDASSAKVDNKVWYYLHGDVKKIFNDFMDPMKTIVVQNLEGDQVRYEYPGYTQLDALTVGSPIPEVCSVRMRKPEE